MAYRGRIAEIPIGFDGLTGSKNLSQVKVSQLLRALNISYESGTIRKEGGSAKYNSSVISGAPKILGGWDWWPTGGNQRMVVYTDDGELLKDSGDGSFGVTLKSGLDTFAVPVFVEGGKEAAANNSKLFTLNGVDAVQVLSADGATTSNLATPPADWSGANQPSFGLIHEGKFWGGGNLNDPHRLYYSTNSDHEDLTGSGSGTIALYPGEGEKLIGAMSFKGLIIAFKRPRGIYLVDTSSATLAEWRVVRLSESIGISSPAAVVQIDDDLLFVDAAGNFQLISAVTAFGDMSSRNLSQASEMGDFIRENLALSQLSRVQGVYYPTKREAHFAMASLGSSVNNRRLVVDFNRLGRPRFRHSDKDTCESLWLRRDTDGILRPTSGDDAGFVWSLDQSTRSKDGAGYGGEFQIPHTDLSYIDQSLGTRRKNAQFLELVVEPVGNWNLSVDILWDGVVRDTVQFNMGQTGAGLGDFVLDTDVLAGSQVLNKRRRITGSGRRFSMVGRNSGAGQDYSVAKAFLHFTPSDERL